MQFSFYFPTIVDSLGYNSTVTLLLTAPPWIWAIIVSLPIAWHADRTGERFFHFFCPALACIVGYILDMATTTVAPRYVGMFLMTSESIPLPYFTHSMSLRRNHSWLRRGLRHSGLDIQYDHAPSCQKGRSNCHGQCHGQYRKHSGLLYLADIIWPLLCQFIRHRHCDIGFCFSLWIGSSLLSHCPE